MAKHLLIYLPGAAEKNRACDVHILLNGFVQISRGQDSVVSVVTCYGLGGPGIKSWWGRDFLHLSELAPGPALPPVQWIPGLFPRGKMAIHPHVVPRLKKE
jgi:hypothetical protein